MRQFVVHIILYVLSLSNLSTERLKTSMVCKFFSIIFYASCPSKTAILNRNMYMVHFVRSWSLLSKVDELNDHPARNLYCILGLKPTPSITVLYPRFWILTGAQSSSYKTMRGWYGAAVYFTNEALLHVVLVSRPVQLAVQSHCARHSASWRISEILETNTAAPCLFSRKRWLVCWVTCCSIAAHAASFSFWIIWHSSSNLSFHRLCSSNKMTVSSVQLMAAFNVLQQLSKGSLLTLSSPSNAASRHCAQAAATGV